MTATAASQLSVLIASHNRRDLLRRCLDSLGRQTQDPGTFEVIVADDGSSDGTAEMLAAMETETEFRLRVLRLEKTGKATVLNTAIEAASGQVCLFLDDDVIASPELVATHLTAHRDVVSSLVIGSLTQKPPTKPDWYAHAYAVAWNERYRELAGKQPDWTDCYGANFSVPRKKLVELGGFSVELPAVEDLELAFRLCNAGCVPIYVPSASAVHDDQKRRPRILADTRGFGAFCAGFAETHPATRPKLLGWFLDTTAREVMLRRLLLALRVPPGPLAAAGRLIPGAGRRQVWFGFVSRCTFWIGVRRNMSRERWLQSTRPVPVLVYHAFGERDEHDRHVLPKRVFARQMKALAALRYRVIPLDDLVQALSEGTLLPRRAAVITIDDGYADNLEIAEPILRRHRFPVTIFLVSRRLSGTNDWSDGGALAGRPLLSVNQVMRLRDEGVRFGAHTRSHLSLPDIPDDAIAEQTSGSRKDLEELLDEPVTSFVYPYGRFDQRVVDETRRAGFLAALTGEGRGVRLSDDPLLMPRIDVRDTDSPLRFLRKIWLGNS